jgi:hypothetical protein
MACFDRALAEDPGLLKLVTENRVQAHVDAGVLPERKAELRRLFDAGRASPAECYELANLLRADGLDALCRRVLQRFVETAPAEWRDEAERARRWLQAPPRG